MTPVDPELRDLLEQTADHNVAAFARLQDEIKAISDSVAGVRKDLRIDRERDDRRFERIEERLDETVSQLQQQGDALKAMGTEVKRIDDCMKALTDEATGPDGGTVITAKPARIGLDAKFIVGSLVAFAGTVCAAILSSPWIGELLR